MATTVARLEAILTANTAQFERSMTSSEGRMRKIGKVAGVAGLAVVSGIAYGLEKSVKAAMDAQVSQARLEQAFKTSRLSAARYSKQVDILESSGRKLGFTDEQTKDSLGSLLIATHNMRKASKDLSVAQDIARFKHIGLTQATKMLTMAQAGSQRASKQLGLSVQASTKNADAAREAYKKQKDALEAQFPSMGKMTNAQKEQYYAQKDAIDQQYAGAKAVAQLNDKQVTAAKVIDLVNKKLHGQADAYSQTAAGGMEQFHAQLQHIEVAIGEKLLPVITTAIQYVMNHWPQISATIQQGWEQIKPTLIAFENLIVSLVGTIRQHWSTIGPIVMGVATVVKSALAIVTGVIKVFAAVLRGDWSGAWNALKGIVVNVFNGLKAYITVEKDIMVALVSGIGTAVWHGFTAALNAGLKGVKGAITGLFGKVIGWVKDVLGISSPSSVFHDIGQHSIQGFINGVGSMGGILKHAVIHMAEDALKHLGGSIGGAIGGVVHAGSFGHLTGGDRRMLRHEDQQVVNAVGFARSLGWRGEITSGFRTYAQQAALYQRYLHGGPLAARPGTSSHEKGQAVDVTDYGKFARIMMQAPGGYKLFNRLGGADPVHFSVSGYDKGGWLPTGLSLAMNNTGSPERVIGPGGGDTVVVQIGPEEVARVVFDQLRGKARVFQRRNGRPAFGGM